MADVVSFQKAREERSPHLAGEALCLACKHQWTAVAPIGTTDLDCPSCGSTRGVFKHPFGPDVGQENFICNYCEATHFVVQRHRVMCVGCGASHQPWAEKP